MRKEFQKNHPGTKRRQYRRSGQSMVEFALCIPFLLLILAGMLFFGRYFLIAQVLLHASQEQAKLAARTPGLDQDVVRDAVRGFSVSGQQVNSTSILYGAMGAAQLLSHGNTGDMPPGSKIEILPWDSDGTAADTIPAGTVAVRIDYPFQLLGNPFTGPSRNLAIAMTVDGSKPAFTFSNFTVTQRAVAAQEVYQNVPQN